MKKAKGLYGRGKRNLKFIFIGFLILTAGLLLPQSSKAFSLKEVLEVSAETRCKLKENRQWLASSEKINALIKEDKYLEAWGEFNAHFWDSEFYPKHPPACYYRARVSELRESAEKELGSLRKEFERLVSEKKAVELESGLDAFKKLFDCCGQFQRDELTRNFYEEYSSKRYKLLTEEMLSPKAKSLQTELNKIEEEFKKVDPDAFIKVGTPEEMDRLTSSYQTYVALAERLNKIYHEMDKADYVSSKDLKALESLKLPSTGDSFVSNEVRDELERSLPDSGVPNEVPENSVIAKYQKVVLNILPVWEKREQAAYTKRKVEEDAKRQAQRAADEKIQKVKKQPACKKIGKFLDMCYLKANISTANSHLNYERTVNARSGTTNPARIRGLTRMEMTYEARLRKARQEYATIKAPGPTEDSCGLQENEVAQRFEFDQKTTGLIKSQMKEKCLVEDWEP